MAYSTWNRRPAGEKVVASVSYKFLQQTSVDERAFKRKSKLKSTIPRPKFLSRKQLCGTNSSGILHYVPGHVLPCSRGNAKVAGSAAQNCQCFSNAAVSQKMHEIFTCLNIVKNIKLVGTGKVAYPSDFRLPAILNLAHQASTQPGGSRATFRPIPSQIVAISVIEGHGFECDDAKVPIKQNEQITREVGTQTARKSP